VLAVLLGLVEAIANGRSEPFAAELDLSSPWQASALRFGHAANEIHLDVRSEPDRLPAPALRGGGSAAARSGPSADRKSTSLLAAPVKDRSVTSALSRQ
jgi:hypothetical protein